MIPNFLPTPSSPLTAGGRSSYCSRRGLCIQFLLCEKEEMVPIPRSSSFEGLPPEEPKIFFAQKSFPDFLFSSSSSHFSRDCPPYSSPAVSFTASSSSSYPGAKEAPATPLYLLLLLPFDQIGPKLDRPAAAAEAKMAGGRTGLSFASSKRPEGTENHLFLSK